MLAIGNDKITKIYNGSNLILETGGGDVTPNKIAGLCLWIDGDCNTRNGNDHSKDYMENLVYNPPYTSTWGTIEAVDNGDNTWNGNLLQYGSWAHYPYISNQELTIDCVVKITSRTTRVGLVQCAYSGGFVLDIPENETNFQFRARDNSSSSYLTLKTPFEYDKLYYLACTIQDGKITLKVNEVNLSNTNFSTLVQPTALVSTAVGTGSTTSSGGNTAGNYKLWYGLNLGMLRIWNRALTDEEIQANYQEAKTRFGV